MTSCEPTPDVFVSFNFEHFYDLFLLRGFIFSPLYLPTTVKLIRYYYRVTARMVGRTCPSAFIATNPNNINNLQLRESLL